MNSKSRPVGRPPSKAATAHDDILSAVHALLQTMSVRDLTIERIAKQAGVGKPTLYKWWPSKADIVLCMLQERVVPALDPPEGLPLAESIRIKARRLVDAFNGFFGAVIAGLIAEGQHDPELLQKLNEEYILPRRAGTVADIRRAQGEGTFPPEIDPEIVVDAVFGSIYFHRITKVHPLTHEYADALVDNLLALTRR
ncbi:TetR/AcrR family transcriptional regulator [Mesorhizobium sp. A623]